MPTDLFGQPDDDIDYHSELVGEGKKFKDDGALAKGKYLADQMVETLKAEKLRLEQELANKMSLEDFYKKIKTEGNEPKIDDILDPSGANQPELPDLEKIVSEALRKSETEKRIKDNESKVAAKLIEVFGDNASKEVSKASAKLGVSPEYLRNLSQQSPDLFFKLLDLDAPKPQPAGSIVPTSTINLPGNEGKERDAAYYRSLRQANPKLYNSKNTQIQMNRDAIRLGESFFN